MQKDDSRQKQKRSKKKGPRKSEEQRFKENCDLSGFSEAALREMSADDLCSFSEDAVFNLRRKWALEKKISRDHADLLQVEKKLKSIRALRDALTHVINLRLAAEAASSARATPNAESLQMNITNFDEYQSLALRTYLPGRASGHCLGLVGEAGEVCDLVKKLRYHGHLDPGNEKMVSELGDVLWYVAALTNDVVVKQKLALDSFSGFQAKLIEDWDARAVEIHVLALDLVSAASRAAFRIMHGRILHDQNQIVGSLQHVIDLVTLMAWLRGENTLQTVAERNIEKLMKRYPEGFSEERSRSREEAS